VFSSAFDALSVLSSDSVFQNHLTASVPFSTELPFHALQKAPRSTPFSRAPKALSIFLSNRPFQNSQSFPIPWIPQPNAAADRAKCLARQSCLSADQKIHIRLLDTIRPILASSIRTHERSSLRLSMTAISRWFPLMNRSRRDFLPVRSLEKVLCSRVNL
jgi:hypothetical protein